MDHEFFEVVCPGCNMVLIVRRKDGVVVETRKPILEDGSGDRFEDAMEKVRRSSSEIERKVEEAREKERTKMARLNALFKEGLERAKDEPIEKPKREFDLD